MFAWPVYQSTYTPQRFAYAFLYIARQHMAPSARNGIQQPLSAPARAGPVRRLSLFSGKWLRMTA